MEQDTQRTTGGDASGVFAPPPYVVEQIRARPECRLLWAVLQEGMETYMKYATATSRRGQRAFADAEQWIGEDDPTWLCSFVSICHVLELDPGYLRAGLQRRRTTTSVSDQRRAA